MILKQQPKTSPHPLPSLKNRFSLLLPACLSLLVPFAYATPPDSAAILKEREDLDKTVWAPEVEAQEYERVFIDLWDNLRAADPAGKFTLLADFPFAKTISWGEARAPEELDTGVRLTEFAETAQQALSRVEWQAFVRSLEKMDVEISQTEWHHSRFVPGNEDKGPRSTISFALHAEKKAIKATYAVKGDLLVQWVREAPIPQIESLSLSKLSLQQRGDEGLFRQVFRAVPGEDDIASSFPILVYDLNNDGRSEIILPRWNRVYWNQKNRSFKEEDFLAHPLEFYESAVLSDFDNDGVVDFITVAKDGKPYFYRGTATGKFPAQPLLCADVRLDFPTAMTAGDADGDGDLDLWIGQYKFLFNEGQMPTPYYDANDGHPSYFLANKGDGTFTDATEQAGLTNFRNRRTYSASFIDLDEDGDLDLVNVADFAGLDIYQNNGKGSFTLATETYVDERHFFGMGHTFGDYNRDGHLDLYVIGMSSTTARRLDRLQLGRDDRPEIHPMRAAMGYGNRLYFGSAGERFREDPKVAAAVARTGWSWGTTSFDFDLDGDLDIYVANGHRSGKSAQDYCSTFWRHDIYTGDSENRPEVLEVFQSTLLDLNTNKISWNGYEKNVLFLNQKPEEERFLDSAALFGAALSFDARSVVSDDLDGDGRPDLLVGESLFLGKGTGSNLHLLANQIDTGTNKRSFKVQLRESPGAGFSPNGAKVVMTDNLGGRQTRWIVTGDSFLAQHAPAAHFGLGEADSVRSVEITWPGGVVENYELEGAVNSTIVIQGGDAAK